MDPRIIVFIILPAIVKCFCNEELGEETSEIAININNRNEVHDMYEDLPEEDPDIVYEPIPNYEYIVHNSTIVCSHLNQITDSSFEYAPRNFGTSSHRSKSANYEQFLKIQTSNISTLPPSAFSKFATIPKLYLRGIHIRLISPEAFQNLKKLRELYLADNELTEVSRGVFNSLHELEVLDLSNNRIQIIEDFALIGAANLKKILLGKNQLSEINLNVFEGIKVLDNLDLSENSIESFSFNDMMISSLNLSFNDLQIVDFYQFPKFENGDFSQNNISILNGTLSDVKIFSISNNRIEVVNLILNNSTHLFMFTLAYNQISSLDEHIFEGLCLLESLDLSHNSLSDIPQMLFHDLEKLISLNLSHNRIERFRFGTFNSLKNLRILDISHNRLVELDYYNLVPMSDLTSLYLEDNQISSLDVKYLTLYFSHFTKLKTVSLADNSWKCQDLGFISQHLKRAGVTLLRGHRFEVENMYGISCQGEISERDYTPDKLIGNVPKEVSLRVKINTSLDDSSFVRFFNSSFRKTDFFKYFDNLKDNTKLDDSNFVRFFNSTFRQTNFFRYFDNLKINVSLGDSDFVKFFNGSFRKTDFFKYFDNLKDNTKLDDSSFVRFFNSSFRKTSFFQYFDNFLKNQLPKEDGARQEKFVSVQRPSSSDHGIFIVGLMVQIIMALSLLFLIYFLIFKKSRRAVSQVTLSQL